MGHVIRISSVGSGGGSGTGWQGQVEFRANLPITLGTPAIGDVYLVEKPTTILAGLYTTYQSGLYIRDFNNGNLNDWRKLNVKVKFLDSEFAVVSAGDESKQAKLDLTGLTTGTTRTMTVQDASGTIAYLSDIPAGAGNNIYNIDGNLTGPRIMTMSGNKLQLDGGVVGLFTVDPTGNFIGIGTAVPAHSLHVESGNFFLKDGVAGIGESPDPAVGLRITTDGTEAFCQRNDVSYLGQTGNFYGLSVRSTTPKSGGTSALFGVNALLQGSATAGAHTAVAITGRAESASGVGTMANIGGHFTALNGTTNFALQLVDGTEGAGKLLQSDATGRTQWVTPPTPLSVATVPEINTGTDNAKYTTPLGLEGSKYLNQSGSKISATAAGTNTYTATIAPTITAYTSTQSFFITFTNANTGASTINLNGLGAKTITKQGIPITSGDIIAGGIYLISYDGTNFQLLGNSNAWTPPLLALGSMFFIGAGVFSNIGAGVFVRFRLNQDDQMFLNLDLRNDNIAYDGSDLAIRLHWRTSIDGGVGDTVGWVVEYAVTKDGDNSDTLVTAIAQQDVDVSAKLANIQFSTTLGTMTGVVGGDVLQVTLTRNGQGAGQDSFAGNARVVGFELIKV